MCAERSNKGISEEIVNDDVFDLLPNNDEDGEPLDSSLPDIVITSNEGYEDYTIDCKSLMLRKVIAHSIKHYIETSPGSKKAFLDFSTPKRKIMFMVENVNVSQLRDHIERLKKIAP